MKLLLYLSLAGLAAAAEWVAGYSNDVFAYIPSLRVPREGGYEGCEAMRFTGLPGPFAEIMDRTRKVQ